MKKIIFFSGLFLIALHCSLLTSYSQLPQGFSYQAIARNTDGSLLVSTALSVKIGLHLDAPAGELVWEETHSTTTNEYGLFSLIIGDPGATPGSGTASTFADINWPAGTYYMNVEVNSQNMGTTQLVSVPFAMAASSVTDLKRLSIVGPGTIHPDSALFEVKRSDGQTVFAVYSDGVQIYVDETAGGKRSKGGFAIGGFDATKGITKDYFIVTPDSVRIYLDTANVKGSKGGFAIGGFDAVKGPGQEFLRVTNDSVRVYIDDQAKGSKGGFAIGGFDAVKGPAKQYLNVSGLAAAEIINPSEPRVLWYPRKEAFLTGRVLIESPDSVGTNSISSGYESKAIGNYSQALGYKTRSSGLNSTAIGNQAQAIGNTSFAFGDGALAKGMGSYAMGSIGRDTLGNITNNPTLADGNYSVAIGLGAKATELTAFAIGTNVEANGISSLAMGYGSVADTAFAVAVGKESTASGYGSFASGIWSSATDRTAIAMGYVAKGWNRFANAIGYRTRAYGEGSTAVGYATLGDGDYSAAFGAWTQATGNYSTAMGYQSAATNYGSTAFGYQTNSSGSYSTTGGYNTLASGTGATAFGYRTEATGNYGTALGYYCKANGSRSTSLGGGMTVTGMYSMGIALDYEVGTTLSQSYTLTIMGGYVGINTLTPVYALELPNTALNYIGRIRAQAYVTYSDSRVKKNDQLLNYGISEIMLLKPRKYDHYSSEFKEGELILGKEYASEIGLFAQEVYPIIPEVVSKPDNDNKDFWSMNYAKLIPVLIKGMQEQQIFIEEQNARIQHLEAEKNELEHLKAQVEEMKALIEAVINHE